MTYFAASGRYSRMPRPKSSNPRNNKVLVCLNDETLALLDRVRSDTSRSAYLRRLLLLAVGPVFDDALTEHVVVRLSPADLGRIQIAKAPSQGEREYILDLIRDDAGSPKTSTYYPPVGPPKP